MQKVKKVVVLGGGYGFYELLPLIEAVNKSKDEKIKVIGILDDNWDLKKVNNYPVLGPLRSWEQFDDSVSFVYAIGSYDSRMSRVNTLNETRIPIERFPSLIHPDVHIMVPRSSVGYGCIIHSGVKVHPLTSIGNFCTISAACVVGVRNFVGSFSLFAAGVYTGTNIRFGSCSFMGTNCVIAPDITIGPGSQIGVGSVVFRDVEPGHKLLGNPAKSYSKDQVPEDLLIYDMEDFNYLKYLSDRLK